MQDIIMFSQSDAIALQRKSVLATAVAALFCYWEGHGTFRELTRGTDGAISRFLGF